MLFTGAAAALIALASAASGCLQGEWASTVAQTEALILHREALRVPHGPAGEKQENVCVRVRFQIDQNGVPQDVRIDQSSQNRSVDVAARETVRKFRFRVPRNDQAPSALVFEYP